MKKEDIQVDIPDSKDVKEERELEEKVGERVDRKRDQVKKMFADHYKVPEDAEFLDALVDREMASAKSFDKLIKQKKKWRSQAQDDTSKEDDSKKDEKDDSKEDDKKPKSSFDRLREVEKTKATKDFLQGIVKKYPEKFPDKQSVSDAYEKIEKEYKESGDETRREDFAVNFKKAFRISHPDLYEEEIKAKERKRLLEDDVDLPELSGEGDKPKKPGRKFLNKTKIDPVKDWYKPKT